MKSARVYEKNLQKLIRGIKYHNQKELAKYLAQFMWEYFQQITNKNNFQVVPVPIYPKREKIRKYNHMMLVAEEFSKLTGYKVDNALITRIKETKPQYRLSIKEREENLKGAFHVDKSFYDGESLLVIDDILTTGSTLKAMIKAFAEVDIYDITAFTTSCTESHVGHIEVE